MEPDDRVCYCYSVALRKLVSFARIEAVAQEYAAARAHYIETEQPKKMF